jgi:hypothetical protein
VLRYHDGQGTLSECDFQQRCRRYASEGFIAEQASSWPWEDSLGPQINLLATTLDQSLLQTPLNLRYQFGGPAPIALHERIRDDWADNLIGAQYLEMPEGSRTKVRIKVRALDPQHDAYIRLKAKESEQDVQLGLPEEVLVTANQPLEMEFDFDNPTSARRFPSTCWGTAAVKSKSATSVSSPPCRAKKHLRTTWSKGISPIPAECTFALTDNAGAAPTDIAITCRSGLVSRKGCAAARRYRLNTNSKYLLTPGTGGMPGCRFRPSSGSPSRRAPAAQLVIRHLQRGEHPRFCRAVVAVVEQADVPALAQAFEEAQQRPGPLGELETQHLLVRPRRGVPANGVAHVQLGQFVVGQVQHLVALPDQARQQLLARVVLRVGLHADEQPRLLAG